MEYISFEWDKTKSLKNEKKHGISFKEAQSVFYDESAVEFFDDTHSDDEDRFLLLGRSNNFRILMICHCVRENESKIRIISARKATKKEQKAYTGESHEKRV